MSLDELRVNPKAKMVVFADILNGVDSSWSAIEKAKYVHDQICKLCTYDSRFIFSNDPALLTSIVSRQVDIDKPEDPMLMCKTLNDVYSQFLSRLHIRHKIVTKPSALHSDFPAKDVALVFYDEYDRPFFTNIAADMQRSKYTMRARFFGGCDDNFPGVRRYTISILKTDKLEEIDRKTGYLKKNGIYADEVFDMIASEVKQDNEFRKTLRDMPALVKKYLTTLGIRNVNSLSDDDLNKYIDGFSLDDLMQIKMLVLNLLPHHDSTYGTIESKKHSVALFQSVFNKGNKRKVSAFDMVRENATGLHVVTIVELKLDKGNVFYRFNEETRQYEMLSIEEALKIQRDYKPRREGKGIDLGS